MRPATIVRRIRALGWEIDLASGPRLVPGDDPAVIPADLMDALRANREQVIRWLASCSLCGRLVATEEDRERLTDPTFCDRGGALAVTDGNGVWHEETPRCPFK